MVHFGGFWVHFGGFFGIFRGVVRGFFGTFLGVVRGCFLLRFILGFLWYILGFFWYISGGLLVHFGGLYGGFFGTFRGVFWYISGGCTGVFWYIFGGCPGLFFVTFYFGFFMVHFGVFLVHFGGSFGTFWGVVRGVFWYIFFVFLWYILGVSLPACCATVPCCQNFDWDGMRLGRYLVYSLFVVRKQGLVLEWGGSLTVIFLICRACARGGGGQGVCATPMASLPEDRCVRVQVVCQERMGQEGYWEHDCT